MASELDIVIIQNEEPVLLNASNTGNIYWISFRYLYTVGLLSPHTLANSLTFICFAINAG